MFSPLNSNLSIISLNDTFLLTKQFIYFSLSTDFIKFTQRLFDVLRSKEEGRNIVCSQFN